MGQKANYSLVHATGRVFSVQESVTLCTYKNEELEDGTKNDRGLHSESHKEYVILCIWFRYIQLRFKS